MTGVGPCERPIVKFSPPSIRGTLKQAKWPEPILGIPYWWGGVYIYERDITYPPINQDCIHSLSLMVEIKY